MKNKLHNAAPDDAVNLIERNIDYCGKSLHLGMPEADALAFLPKPHNTNTENVCVWIVDYSKNIQNNEPLNWQWLQSTKGGYFMVFLNGKLATPLCANAAYTPWEALQDYGKITDKQAKQILGQK